MEKEEENDKADAVKFEVVLVGGRASVSSSECNLEKLKEELLSMARLDFFRGSENAKGEEAEKSRAIFRQIMSENQKEENDDPVLLGLRFSEPERDGMGDWELDCSSCQRPIRGFRYSCTVCPAFDTCAGCESAGLHPQHDMVRMSSPDKLYPPHFFARIHRLYERADFSSSTMGFRPPRSKAPGMEPIVGEDGLCLCCGDEEGGDPCEEEDLDVEDEEKEESRPPDKLLPSVEEVTKGVEDLTEKNMEMSSDTEVAEDAASEATAGELGQILRETTEHLDAFSAYVEADEGGEREKKEDEVQADVSVGEEEPKIAVEQETVVPVEIADAMEEEGEGEEGEEGYMEEEEEEVVGEEKIDTIQGLQQEIDKLLAPLTSTPDSPWEDLATGGNADSPFEMCGRVSAASSSSSAEVVTVEAVIESDRGGGGSFNKRVLRNSSSDDNEDFGQNPSKATSKPPRKVQKTVVAEAEASGIHLNPTSPPPPRCHYAEEVGFDAITVAEVVEIEQEEEVKEEVEEENEEEEGEGEEEEEDVLVKEEDQVEQEKPKTTMTLKMPPSARERWGLRKKPGEDAEANEDPFARMELRRALHRAGLDPTLITSLASSSSIREARASRREREEEEEVEREKEEAKRKAAALEKEKEEEEERRRKREKEKEEEFKPWRSRFAEKYNSSSTSYSSPSSSLPLSPRVRESLDQMLSMGFTDDDGWLTQLLVMKKGDVAEVLEVLSPVDKKKGEDEDKNVRKTAMSSSSSSLSSASNWSSTYRSGLGLGTLGGTGGSKWGSSYR